MVLQFLVDLIDLIQESFRRYLLDVFDLIPVLGDDGDEFFLYFWVENEVP